MQIIIRINQILLHFFYYTANLLCSTNKHHILLQNIFPLLEILGSRFNRADLSRTMCPFFPDVDYSIELFVNEGCPNLALMIDHLFAFEIACIYIFISSSLCICISPPLFGTEGFSCWETAHRDNLLTKVLLLSLISASLLCNNYYHYHSLSYHFRFTLLPR